MSELDQRNYGGALCPSFFMRFREALFPKSKTLRMI